MISNQPGFWDIEERLRAISVRGDRHETLHFTVDFELFHTMLVEALGERDPSKGGHPGLVPVLKLKMLVLQSMHGLPLEQTKCLVSDRLSWMRFCDLSIHHVVPDANTLWDFREAEKADLKTGRIPEA